jgi:hypothetical protein
LQKKIVETILKVFNLEASECRSTPMGCSGEDVWMSDKARKVMPWAIESKCQEKLNIWASLKQAEGENRKYPPLLVFSKNRTLIYCALKFDDFMNIMIHINALEKRLEEIDKDYKAYEELH